MANRVVHEIVVELLRARPALARTLLPGHLGRQDRRQVRLADTALHEVVPATYAADLVVLFGGERPTMGLVVEVQTVRDPAKRYTWPYYAVALRARHRCPVMVLVVVSKPNLVDWAARPIDIGPGNTFVPVVVGPAVPASVAVAPVRPRSRRTAAGSTPRSPSCAASSRT